MHLGQTVRFLDFRDGQMRRGKIIAMRDTQATVLEEGTRIEWKLPDTKRSSHRRPRAAPANSSPSEAAANRNDFRCGEKVSFEDRYLQTQVGTIVRINQRTATIDTGDGHSWQVGFALLRHVLDV